MHLLFHVEVTGEEQPLIYEGESTADALAFVEQVFVKEPHRVQCNCLAEINDEKRALSRVARTPEAAEFLLRDAMAWITEVDPSLIPAEG